MLNRRFTRLILTAILLWVAGCTISEVESITQAPTIEPVVQEIVGDPTEAMLRDAQAFADELGIDVAEALFRLSLQDTIGRLNARLQSEQSDTFAGLWIEHEPTFRLITAFTRDGEATLAPYIVGTDLVEIVEVRTVALTYRELQALQANINGLLGPTDTSFSSGVNIQENLVEVYVTDLGAFAAGIEAQDIQLPENVRVVEIYEPLGDELPFDVNPDDSIYFPQLKSRSTSFMEALLIATLVVEDGCLRAHQDESNESYTIVWQTDYFLNNNDGLIEMLDREGNVVARVGETIYLGGGEVRQVDAEQLRAPVPERCAGPKFWLMGEFLPAEYIPNVTGASE